MYPLDFEEFLWANGMSTGVIKAKELTYNRNYNMNIFSLFKKKGESGLTYSELETWLNEVMQMTIPVDVVAFCFNLYEDVNKSWTLELIDLILLIRLIVTGHAMKCLLPETNHLSGMKIKNGKMFC